MVKSNEYFVPLSDNIDIKSIPEDLSKFDAMFCMGGPMDTWMEEQYPWLIDEKRCYRGRQVNINTHVDGRQSFDIMGREIRPKPIKSSKFLGHKKRAV